MSDERETGASRAAETPESSVNPGAPVEETEASRTEILEAVERSKGASDSGSDDAATAGAAVPAEGISASEADGPGAGSDAASAEGGHPDPLGIAERRHREEVSAVDTQLDLEPPVARGAATSRIGEIDELPSAAADPVDSPARDGEIRISADHPMAALYMQSPMPPELKGNRGAGVLIALVATLGFAAVYAGALAAWLAPMYPPSVFLSEGFLPLVTSWGFFAAVLAFFVGLVLLILIVGRAGWWAYVLGGFFVAVFVWAAALAAFVSFGGPWGRIPGIDGLDLSASGIRSAVNSLGFTFPLLAAAAVAREATVWFGAWIGFRGRRVKLRNAEALAEYESAMAEVQAKQP